MDQVGREEVVRIEAQLEALHATGSWREAIPLVERLLEIFTAEALPNVVDVAGCHFNLGFFHEQLYDWAVAQGFYERAIDTLQQRSDVDPLTLVPARDRLAGVLRTQGRYPEAEGEYRKLLELLECHDRAQSGEAAGCLNDLAIVLRRQGRHEESEHLFLRALPVIEAVSGADSPDAGQLHGNLASLYVEIRRLADAETRLDRMQTIFDAKVYPGHSAFAMLAEYRAALHSARGELARAEKLDRRALSIRERVLAPDDPLLLSSIHALGVDRFALGWWGDARELLERALEARERILGPDHPDTSDTRNSLAAVLEALGLREDAERTFRGALEARRRALGPLHAKTLTSLNNLASALESLGRYDEAASLYDTAITAAEKAWPSSDPRLGSLLNNRALLSSSMEATAEAESLFSRALAIEETTLALDDPRIADTLMNLGLLRWKSGAPHDACDMLRRASAIYEHHVDFLMDAGAERQKRASLQAAHARMSVLVALHLRVLPSALAARELAVDVVLQQKGRLLDGLARPLHAVAYGSDTNAAALLAQWKVVRTERAALAIAKPHEVDEAHRRDTLRRLEREEEQLELAMSSVGASPRTVRASRVAVTATLAEGTALLEYVRYVPYTPAAVRGSRWEPPRYGVYLLDAGGVRAFADLGDADTIDAAITAFRQALNDASLLWETHARGLYTRLLQPVLESRRYRQLFVSPDDLLNAVPFAALLTADGRYLVEDVAAVSHVYSGRDLLRPVSTGDLGGFVVVAAPDFGTSEVAPGAEAYDSLPGALDEARLIGTILPSAELLTGAKASKAALKARARPSLLHVATHGEYHELTPSDVPRANAPWSPADASAVGSPERNPLLDSWLALAGANVESRRGDALLSALEITTLDLHGTELVTLSACDTGIGEVRAGDGIYGLTRAFLLAGARSVLAALWSVDDAGTCELMWRVYTQLRAGSSRAHALCNVQREMLRIPRYAHPLHWSGFHLIGASGPIAGLARMAAEDAVRP